MAEFANSTTSGLATSQDSLSVSNASLDSPGVQDIEWTNPNFTKYMGYYNEIAPLRRMIIALTTWTVGKGYNVSASTEVLLDHIKGMGHESFQNVLENHSITELINGDAYTQIIRKDDSDPRSIITNLKPLNPSTIKKVVDSYGMVKKFVMLTPDKNGKFKEFKPHQIFHTMADRVGDQIHGTGIIEACQWVVDAWFEVLKAQRTVVQRNINPLKIIQIDANSTTAFSEIKELYHDMTGDYEALFVPINKVKVDIPNIPLMDVLPYIQYLESLFYQVGGVPRIIATSEQYTEANSKMGYVTFEPVYTRRQALYESAIWNQLGIMIKFNRPAELSGMVASSEAKNTGQIGIQPNDFTAQVGRQ